MSSPHQVTSTPATSVESSPELKPVTLTNLDEKNLDADINKSHELPYDDAGAGEPEEAVQASGNRLPWTRKLPILLFVLFLTFGSNFAHSSIAPLKSTIRKELGINNAQYGVISSAVSLVNTIWPLIAGMAMDYYGPAYGTLASSCMVLLGQIVSSVGASTRSYKTLLAGQLLFGFGSTSIEVGQSAMYAFYFKGVASPGYLGFVSGLDIGLGRVFNLAGKLSAVPIVEGTGSFAWGFWVPTIICAATLVLNLVYVIFDARQPESERIPTGRRIAALEKDGKTFSGKRRSSFSFIGLQHLTAAFWILPLSQLLQNGVISAWTSNLADVVIETRGSNRLSAGYTASLGQVIPIVLTPVLGFYFDRFGRRAHFIAGTAALWILVFCLMAFSHVHPLCPIILASVALAANALPFIAILPLLVDQKYMATAAGVWKSFQNSNSTVVDISVGSMQDRALARGQDQYRNMFIFLIAMKAVDVLIGLVYDAIDRRYLGRVLYNSERRRVAQESHLTQEEVSSGLRRPNKMFSFVGIGTMVSMIIISYVLFIYYSM